MPNKSHYPPEFQQGSRLAFYASLFNSLEVNSTFYKLPLERTVARWVSEVPDGFSFSFKLWKVLTHCKELVYDPGDMRRFFTSISPAVAKKGAVLVQFPASIKFSFFARVRKLLSDLADANTDGWPIAVEFRDSSWYNDRVYQMLESFSCAIVIQDMPKSATPLIDMEAPFVYQRFHGELGDYRGSYDEDLLHEHAGYMSEWLKEGKDVYVYFNNSLGKAVQNLLTLNGFMNIIGDKNNTKEYL